MWWGPRHSWSVYITFSVLSVQSRLKTIVLGQATQRLTSVYHGTLARTRKTESQPNQTYQFQCAGDSGHSKREEVERLSLAQELNQPAPAL